MNKQRIGYLAALTGAVVLALAVFIGSTIGRVNGMMREFCFGLLDDAAEQLADNIYCSVDMDRTVLNAMAAIIAETDAEDKAQLCRVLRSYHSSASYIAYVELLRPDNTMLQAGGHSRDVSGQLDFATEAQKGAYLSNLTFSTLDSQEPIVRNAVPVVRNGETVYMLYGVVRLADMPSRFRTTIYDGHAYVNLMDGDSGDFLLDTWHGSFGNVRDFSRRKMLGDYDFTTVTDDMANSRSGDVAFVSQTTGQPLYMHYEPVGINNWTVAVMVEEKYGLAESEAVSSLLYRLAAVVGVVMAIYTGCVFFILLGAYRQVKRLGAQDLSTGLQNRAAYDKFLTEARQQFFPDMVCIYADANGLHELNNRLGHAAGDAMLRAIADALRTEFRYKAVYRIGGDEFVVYCANADLSVCEGKMKNVERRLAADDYHIAYAILRQENAIGLDALTQEADAQMLENKRLYYQHHERRHR